MAEEFLAELRAENASLLNQLRKGVSKLQIYVENEKQRVSSELKAEKDEIYRNSRVKNKLDFSSTRKATEKGPSSQQASGKMKSRKSRGKEKELTDASISKAVTSTPVAVTSSLEFEGNLRRQNSKEKSNVFKRLRSPHMAIKPKSILVTPDRRKVMISIMFLMIFS